MDGLRPTDRRMVTSNYVMAESHALILRRSNRQIALAFLDNLLSSNVRILRLEPEEELLAIDLLRQFADKDFSFTDATSFVLMDRLRIHDAFAFDEDFARYGFTLLT